MTRAIVKANWDHPIPPQFQPLWDIYTQPPVEKRGWIQLWIRRYTVGSIYVAHAAGEVLGYRVWKIMD